MPIRLTPAQYQALKAYAHFTHKSMNDVVSYAINDFLTGPGRIEQMQAMATAAQHDYRGALDKLKEL